MQCRWYGAGKGSGQQWVVVVVLERLPEGMLPWQVDMPQKEEAHGQSSSCVPRLRYKASPSSGRHAWY